MKKLLIALGLIGIQISCQQSREVDEEPLNRPPNFVVNSDSPLQGARGSLVSATHVITLSEDELNARFGGSVTARNGIHVYRIEYESVDLNNAPIILSGAAFIPDNSNGPFPVVALQHGTISAKANAPSVRPREGILEASQGFAALAIDYMGFGSSSQLLHPYLIEESYAVAGVDGLRAIHDFANQRGLTFAGLFLKGYSEGGYATLAMQKAIELNPAIELELASKGLPLIASAPSAGPHQLANVATTAVNGGNANPVYIVKVTGAYKQWFAEDIPGGYSDILNQNGLGAISEANLAERLNGFFLTGAWDFGKLLELLPKQQTELLSDTLIEDFALVTYNERGEILDTDVDRTGLLAAMDANNLAFGWSPKTPTRLYHCVGDEVVPHESALTAKIAFDYYDDLDSSTPNEMVQVVSIPDPDNGVKYGHGNCPAINLPLQWFAGIIQGQNAAN